MQAQTPEDENVSLRAEVERFREREKATKQILDVISQCRDDEMPVFRTILNCAQRLCNAQASGLQLLNKTGTHLRYVVSGGIDRRTFTRGLEIDINEPLAMTASVRESKVQHIADLKDEVYESGNPIRVKVVDEEGINTTLAVPLLRNGEAFGNINLNRHEQRAFSDDEIALVETFAAQAVIAIENVRQFKQLEDFNTNLGKQVEEQVAEIERMAKLKRFLPSAVADTVISSGSEKMLLSHRALLGVLFCDIRGFTAFCETAEPEETIEVLQTYHEEMGRLINAYGAGVDHRMGDGIMVLFNDPFPCDDPAGDAVRLALAMRARMAELSKQWNRMGYKLGFGVGVSLGYATIGTVGFEGRFDYTASGTAINLASRLCDEAQDGEILLTPKAVIAIEENYRVQSRGELSLKGLREPLEVFRLNGVAER